MSFEINWDNLISDETIHEAIREFLDGQLRSLDIPSFISDLSVSSFNLGTKPPDISIIHIGNPFDEFYDDGLKDIDERLENFSMNMQTKGYDSSTDEDNDSTNLSISEDLEFQKPFTMEFPKIGSRTGSEIKEAETRSRNSSDSLSLMLGNKNLNFLHNHNINNLGLGSLNTPSHSTTRADTPTRFLNHGKRENSNPYIKTKRVSEEKDSNDMQVIVEVNYQGDMEIIILVNLLVNYPSPKFISLPIRLHITDLVIHSIAVIAYLKKSVFISFLCDINDQTSDYFTSSFHRQETSGGTNTGGNFVDYVNNGSTQERIDIIKKVKIESEIGGVEQNVLRNVGKVEKFLIDGLRGLLRDEIAWPSWICLDLNPEEEQDEQEEGDVSPQTEPKDMSSP